MKLGLWLCQVWFIVMLGKISQGKVGTTLFEVLLIFHTYEKSDN